MSTPVIAVVGRPNIGKSTIFNRIVGERISIVEDIAGVTRDRIYSEGEWLGHSFNIIDTGGIDITDEPFMSKHPYASRNCDGRSRCDYLSNKCKRGRNND